MHLQEFNEKYKQLYFYWKNNSIIRYNERLHGNTINNLLYRIKEFLEGQVNSYNEKLKLSRLKRGRYLGTPAEPITLNEIVKDSKVITNKEEFIKDYTIAALWESAYINAKNSGKSKGVGKYINYKNNNPKVSKNIRENFVTAKEMIEYNQKYDDYIDKDQAAEEAKILNVIIEICKGFVVTEWSNTNEIYIKYATPKGQGQIKINRLSDYSICFRKWSSQLIEENISKHSFTPNYENSIQRS